MVFAPLESKYTVIPMEINRDVAQQYVDEGVWTQADITHVQQLVTIHEIGHQFELKHPKPDDPNDPNDHADPDYKAFPTGWVMSIPADNVEEQQSPQLQIKFSQWDIDEIRDIGEDEHP